MRKSAELKQRLDDVRAKREAARVEMEALARRDQLTEGQSEHFERLGVQVRRLGEQETELDLDVRRAFTEEVTRGLADGTVRQIAGSPEHAHYYEREADLTSSALRSLDKLTAIPADRADAMETAIRSSTQFAAEFEAHSSPAYERAFFKLLRHGEQRGHLSMTPEEQNAMAHAFNVAERAMAEGTGSTGGYGVPTAIDPTILMSAQGSSNAILDISRQVDVVTNVFKGVSSAGVTWSFDAEAATVSDDTPTLAQPSATVYTARGFVPYSIEVEQDYAGFQSEMAKLLGEGYMELLADKLARGNGTTEPRGILTAMAAASGSQVVSTTDGAFAAADIYKVWRALPERFRTNARWVMSVDIATRIKQFESGNGAIMFPEVASGNLLTRPLHTSSYFPDYTATTGAEVRCVVGDWSNFVVARRAGMRIELVPHLVDTTSNRPTGQRGAFAWARIGSNSFVDAAFAELTNS